MAASTNFASAHRVAASATAGRFGRFNPFVRRWYGGGSIGLAGDDESDPEGEDPGPGVGGCTRNNDCASNDGCEYGADGTCIVFCGVCENDICMRQPCGTDPTGECCGGPGESPTDLALVLSSW